MFYKPAEVFFSIIIPTYNRAHLIRKTLESVFNQSYTNYEIIVVDDGSIDNTEEVIKSIRHIKLFYFKKENSERGAARNFGMQYAKGEYVTFLDSDDLLYKDYLNNAYESICQNKFPAFFHLAYELKNLDGSTIFKANRIESHRINFLIKGNNLSCMGIFMNTNILNEYRFNEDRQLAGSEDWELWLRVAAKYGIITDNRISACIVNHSGRSVSHYDEDKLITRKKQSLRSAIQDKNVRKKFGNQLRKIEASCDLYIALHLVLSKNKTKARDFLTRALWGDPFLLFDKRCISVIKRLILRTSKETI
jgi:glycosyltransferase involved in cell wall biosynthesis